MTKTMRTISVAGLAAALGAFAVYSVSANTDVVGPMPEGAALTSQQGANLSSHIDWSGANLLVQQAEVNALKLSALPHEVVNLAPVEESNDLQVDEVASAQVALIEMEPVEVFRSDERFHQANPQAFEPPIPLERSARPVLPVVPQAVAAVVPARSVSVDPFVNEEVEGSWPRRLDQINARDNAQNVLVTGRINLSTLLQN